MRSTRKKTLCLLGVLVVGGAGLLLARDESLFREEIARSAFVREIFSFIDAHREDIIKEWIHLTEIPAPSGSEAERAQYIEAAFNGAGLEGVHHDPHGNVIGIWRGSEPERRILITAHMDTVFQGVEEIRVRREGNVLKAPGIGDDTASLVNMLWSIRALKNAGFRPRNTLYFVATVGEETGFVGMRAFLDEAGDSFDTVLALDGDLGKVHYGALGFGGGRVVFRGPGAHTMLSRGVPNPNLAVAEAVERIYEISLPESPLERWTVLNIGILKGGRVRNAVAQESMFTVDLRSASQEELEKAQKEIRRICQEVAEETGVEWEIQLDDASRAHQIPGARDSSLVTTLVDILEYLGVRDIAVDPLGSTEANVGIEKGILNVNLGRTYGRYKHSLREEAEIDGLFLAIRQILLMLVCLD
ncbi:MAG: M20 family metallopeptidase [Candidatus Aminicenantales bacterium]